MENFLTRFPDVEVTFRFNGTRKTGVRDGYRPAHRVREDYLTSGLHRYFDAEEVAPRRNCQGDDHVPDTGAVPANHVDGSCH